MLLVVWATEAEEDLLNIIQFIGERNPSAAERMAELIKESTWPISEHPMLFKRSTRMLGCREIVVHPNYILVYKIGMAQVEVLRVLHSRQQYP